MVISVVSANSVVAIYDYETAKLTWIEKIEDPEVVKAAYETYKRYDVNRKRFIKQDSVYDG